MKLYLTEKFYKDTHNSHYFANWEKELTDIWEPTYLDGENRTCAVSHVKGHRRCSSAFYFNDDKTFRVELGGAAKPNKKGKRSVYLEDFNKCIEQNVLVLAKLIQHGYARLEE